MLTRPANSNTRAVEAHSHDEVGFRNAVEEWKKTLKPLGWKQRKLDDANFDQGVEDLNINGR